MAFSESFICGRWASAADDADMHLILDEDTTFELSTQRKSLLGQLVSGTLRGDWSLADDQLRLKIEGRLSTSPALSVFNQIPHIALLNIINNWTGRSTARYTIERLTSYELWITPEGSRHALKFDRER